MNDHFYLQFSPSILGFKLSYLWVIQLGSYRWSQLVNIALMTQTTNNTQQALPSLVQNIKNIFSKLNWKHGLILSASIGLIIYPQPLIKLFLPIVSKISKNHRQIPLKNNVKEIILTSNENLSLEAISRLQIEKGPKPRIKEFQPQQCKTLETPKFNLGKSVITQSGASLCQELSQETSLLFGQTLWNNFRIAKLQNEQLRLILVKSSETILKVFLLRFYGMNDDDIHKIGSLSPNKIHILRLDERVGTYEHLIAHVPALNHSLK